MQSDRRDCTPCKLGSERSSEPREDRCLDELGMRLHRDAVRLAARYPAATCRKSMLNPEHRSRGAAPTRIAWLTAAAALVIAASLWLLDGRQDHPAPDRSLAVSSPAESAASAAETPGFLLEVSDPELEALLDLWESEGTEPTRLSI